MSKKILRWHRGRIQFIRKKLKKWLLKNHKQNLYSFRNPRPNEIEFKTEEGGSGTVKFVYKSGKWIIEEME